MSTSAKLAATRSVSGRTATELLPYRSAATRLASSRLKLSSFMTGYGILQSDLESRGGEREDEEEERLLLPCNCLIYRDLLGSAIGRALSSLPDAPKVRSSAHAEPSIVHIPSPSAAQSSDMSDVHPS